MVIRIRAKLLNDFDHIHKVGVIGQKSPVCVGHLGEYLPSV